MIRIQQADEIYDVNSWIKKNFRNSFTVEELAEQKNMSVSQFIRDYRKMLGQSPYLQTAVPIAGTGDFSGETGKKIAAIPC